MLFNIRAAATAALAFLAVPSVATDPGSIINAIHQLTAKTHDLQNNCQSIGQGGLTQGFGGIFVRTPLPSMFSQTNRRLTFPPPVPQGIGDTFTQVVTTAKTTWSIIQSAQSISITFTEEESTQITQAWGDCLDAQNGLLGILNGGTDLFSQIASDVFDAIQQLQGIFDNIQGALLVICSPPQHPQLQDWWPPVNNAFDDCINQFGGLDGGPGPALPPPGAWGQGDHPCDGGCDDGDFHGKGKGGWRRKRAFVA
ncbi:hypothetical protein SLS56_012241 [Neofusicoccum ribis]|uniref:Uncharacterized protein n=1 Tax=Neofusicoccum ribis TaxID=45134 RepID=A0ABR3S9E5_9PEZI